MTMLVGILMMRSFMDWLQRLLQYPLDVIVISSWRRNHARHQTVWLSVFSLLAKCFVCVHFLLLEGLDFALHGCFYILLHQLTVGFIYFKQGYILLFVFYISYKLDDSRMFASSLLCSSEVQTWIPLIHFFALY